MQRVLRTHHFHVVFTLPAELRRLALRNRSLVFELIMTAAADSLLELGRDPKWLGAPAQLGITAVLHTWTRELAFHPHVHCIVTGGGLADDGSRWIAAPGEFLFPVRVLAALFRGKVLDGLARARRDGRLRLAPEDEGRAAAHRTDALHRASRSVLATRTEARAYWHLRRPRAWLASVTTACQQSASLAEGMLTPGFELL